VTDGLLGPRIFRWFRGRAPLVGPEADAFSVTGLIGLPVRGQGRLGRLVVTRQASLRQAVPREGEFFAGDYLHSLCPVIYN
jgi:hypothetical protein